jgi:hypothetical protein
LQVLTALNGLSIAHADYVLKLARESMHQLQQLNLSDASFRMFAVDMAAPEPQPDEVASSRH